METSYRIYEDLSNILDYIFCIQHCFTNIELYTKKRQELYAKSLVRRTWGLNVESSSVPGSSNYDTKAGVRLL